MTLTADSELFPYMRFLNVLQWLAEWFPSKLEFSHRCSTRVHDSCRFLSAFLKLMVTVWRHTQSVCFKMFQTLKEFSSITPCARAFGNSVPNAIGAMESVQETRLHALIHLVVCLTSGPKPLPNRALHIVRSRASSFKCEYPLLFLRSSSSFLRLLPRLPVTSIPSFIFPSITRFRRQCDQSS